MEETYKRPSIDYPYFPGNLRRIRKEKGLSFRMLSLICEATPSNLCRYEQGIHMPRTKTLESISRALGVPVNELLGPLKINDEVAGEGSTSGPVAYVSGSYGGYCVIQPIDRAVVLPVGLPLYTSPPTQETVECMCGICKLGKREWVGLTDEEIWKCNKASGNAVEFHICYEHQNVEDFAESIEAKLREKNT